MSKFILKILYAAIILIISVFAGMIFFNTYRAEHIIEMAVTSVKNSDYSELAHIFGGLYYDEKIEKLFVNNNTDETKDNKFEMAVFPAISEELCEYKLEGNEKKSVYHKFDKAYSFYILDVSNTVQRIKRTQGEYHINDYGLKFYGEDNKSYIYRFTVNATTNESYYVATDLGDTFKTKNDSILNKSRDLTVNYTNYGFINCLISESKLNAIKEILASDILSFNLCDSNGEDVLAKSIDYTFNFTGETEDKFYQNKTISNLIDSYNKFFPYYDFHTYNPNKDYSVSQPVIGQELDDTEYERQVRIINRVSDDLKESISQKTIDTKIMTAMTEDELIPSSFKVSAGFKTAGIIALILVVAFVIYMLLFHFQFIRSVIFRENRHTQIRAKIPNKEIVEDKKNMRPKQEPKKQLPNKKDNALIDAKDNQTTKSKENDNVIEANETDLKDGE